MTVGMSAVHSPLALRTTRSLIKILTTSHDSDSSYLADQELIKFAYLCEESTTTARRKKQEGTSTNFIIMRRKPASNNSSTSGIMAPQAVIKRMLTMEGTH